MFLDYDGTLSDIVENPEKAFMTNKVNSLLLMMTMVHCESSYSL